MPFISRLEYEKGKWVPRHWPPNFGARRDIPSDADMHPSLIALSEAGVLQPTEIPRLVMDRDHYTFKHVPDAEKQKARERKRREKERKEKGEKNGVVDLDLSNAPVSDVKKNKREEESKVPKPKTGTVEMA